MSDCSDTEVIDPKSIAGKWGIKAYQKFDF